MVWKKENLVGEIEKIIRGIITIILTEIQNTEHTLKILRYKPVYIAQYKVTCKKIQTEPDKIVLAI